MSALTKHCPRCGSLALVEAPGAGPHAAQIKCRDCGRHIRWLPKQEKMMSSVNKVILIGNLGRDPEVRATQGGQKIVSLSIATSETWKDGSGERQERTEWHRVVIFNERLAEVAEKYLAKGRTVYLEGQLQTRKWTDQSGAEKFSTEVVLSRFRGDLVLLGGGEKGQVRDGRTYGERRDAPENRVSARDRDAAIRAQAPLGSGRQQTAEELLEDSIPF